MANEITGMVSDQGFNFPAIVATGSVVAGDLVSAYQTATDDMFAAADVTTFTTGSVAILRTAIGAVPDKSCVGIALNDAASGDTTTVAAQGLFIVTSTGTVTAGYKVMPEAQGVLDYNDDASGAGYIIGRAVTGASAAAKFVLVRLSV